MPSEKRPSKLSSLAAPSIKRFALVVKPPLRHQPQGWPPPPDEPIRFSLLTGRRSTVHFGPGCSPTWRLTAQTKLLGLRPTPHSRRSQAEKPTLFGYGNFL